MVPRRRLFAGLVVAGAIGGLLASTAAGSTASAIDTGTGSGGAVASISPSAALTNEQIVTVTWSGFNPTVPDPLAQYGRYKDVVGVYECVAKRRLPKTDQHYNYRRDCYTAIPPDAQLYPNAGNMVDPNLNQVGLYGVTGSNGRGQVGFEVQEGTLHTANPELLLPNNKPWPAFNIQCDQTHPCVLKVIDYGIYYEKYSLAPNLPYLPLKKGDWSELADAAPSVPIAFSTASVCPPPESTTPQINIEGAGSTSYAIQAWSEQLCTAKSPIALNYTTTGEVVARNDFEGGTTDVALAALPPASVSGGRPYVAAPTDVNGVVIAFDMFDPATSSQITTVRLTARLLAMLVTDSAVYGNLYSDAADYYPLMADPEFQALNPGYVFPAADLEPLLEGAGTDDTQILTQWMADDADAMAFLAGHDVCGAQLNPNWVGQVHYPTSVFEDLEKNPTTTQPWSGYYNPLTNLLQEVTDLFFDRPAGFNPVDPTGTTESMPAVIPNQEALFGEIDNTSAIRSAEPTASLAPASATSTIFNYVTMGKNGKCVPNSLTSFPAFSAPTPSSLALGVHAMAPNPDGTLRPPVTTTVAGAYPLTKVDYAFMPKSGLTTAQAGALAGLADYIAGPGQGTDVLPYGYSPLPSSLTAQDTAAAGAVLKSVALPTVPPKTVPTTVPSVSSTHSTIPTVVTTPSITTPPAETNSTPTSTARQASGSTNPVAIGPTNGAAQASYEGPVSVGAIERTGWWLLPLLAALALGMGLAGGLVGWDNPLSRRLKRKAP